MLVHCFIVEYIINNLLVTYIDIDWQFLWPQIDYRLLYFQPSRAEI